MPIGTPTSLTNGSDLTPSTVNPTAAVTLASGTKYYLFVRAEDSVSFKIPSSISGNGTWTQVATRSGAATNFNTGTLYRAVGAGGGAAVVNINFTSAPDTMVAWRIVAVPSVDTAVNQGTVQNGVNSGTATSLSITLGSAIGAGNATLGFIATESGGGSVTPGSGYTELGDADGIQVEYDVTGTTTVNWTGLSAGVSKAAIGVEEADLEVTLSASPGSYILTGANAGLLAERLINAVPGSYALTGFATTLLLTPYSLSASPGSYALSGSALGFGFELFAAPGGYTLTGFAASLGIPRVPIVRLYRVIGDRQVRLTRVSPAVHVRMKGSAP